MTKDYETRHVNICNALAESVLTASDEEIEEEAGDKGIDPEKASEHVKQLLLEVVEQRKRAAIEEEKFLEQVRKFDYIGFGRMMEIVSREYAGRCGIAALTIGPCLGDLNNVSRRDYLERKAADPLQYFDEKNG